MSAHASANQLSRRLKKDLFTGPELVLGLDHASAAIPAAIQTARENGIVINSELPIPLVVAGGTVSVLLHNLRNATHDLDFYHPDEAVRKLLTDVGRSVAKELDWEGAFYWMNDAVTSIIEGHPSYASVYHESIEIATVIYRSPALILYAVKMDWQLHRKMSRLSRDIRLRMDIRPTDLEDAVLLLDTFCSAKKRPMKKSEFMAIYAEAASDAKIENAAVELLAGAFFQKYQRTGLLLSE